MHRRVRIVVGWSYGYMDPYSKIWLPARNRICVTIAPSFENIHPQLLQSPLYFFQSLYGNEENRNQIERISFSNDGVPIELFTENQFPREESKFPGNREPGENLELIMDSNSDILLPS